ncbi:phosphodiesterase, partial [Escherichia coli]|nr:phosphodiesterase [Escherichia coli]
NPDSKEVMRDEPWDLMLCGHTHGGQLRVPLVGEPFAPVEDKRYVAGLNAFGERHIYTTRGVGSLYGLRLNSRPEVTMLELV